MTFRTKYLAAAAAIGAVAAPAAAQYGYQQQTYPGYAQPAYGYGQQAYGQQGYAQNPVGAIVDQLLGNRYNVSDRQAVSRCASAVMTQASTQYGNGYNNGYGHNGYNRGYSDLRVTGINDVQRRGNGLRVTGTLGSANGGYGGQYGYQHGGGYGDLSFRCNVAYNGAVTNIRINRSQAYRR